MSSPHTCCRRSFLRGTLGCGAYTLYALSLSTVSRHGFAASHSGRAVKTEAFARVEPLSDGVWAVVSTPNNGDSTTVSNSGIIAGNDAVVTLEGSNTPKGGAWLRQTAKELTGRYPTHVVLTHHHGDHSNGLSGYTQNGESPVIYTTAKTQGLLNESQSVEKMKHLDPSKPTRLDLGGKTLSITPRLGHTPSDLTLQLEDPNIIWCGDLFFNHMFPYFGDAIPGQLSKTCNAFMKDEKAQYVPGHGSVAKPVDVKHYLALLDLIAEAAKKAHQEGKPADEAWQEFSIPASMGEWSKFRPDIYKFAFIAWEKELKG